MVTTVVYVVVGIEPLKLPHLMFLTECYMLGKGRGDAGHTIIRIYEHPFEEGVHRNISGMNKANIMADDINMILTSWSSSWVIITLTFNIVLSD